MRYLLLFSLILFNTLTNSVLAQTDTALIKSAMQSSTLLKPASVTVQYNIDITKKRGKAGIEETYNGGVQTLFGTPGKARLRLVTLMRIQSTFFQFQQDSLLQVNLLKESGKKKYRYYFSKNDWYTYNQKYAGSTVVLQEDSLMIANYRCKKAVITLPDERSIEVWYTDSIAATNQWIMPAFNNIPGLVLKYAYHHRKGSIAYTASAVSLQPIEANLLKLPTKGFIVKKYCATCPIKKRLDTTEDSEESNLQESTQP